MGRINSVVYCALLIRITAPGRRKLHDEKCALNRALQRNYSSRPVFNETENLEFDIKIHPPERT